ncbi:hypothetical protein ACGFW5_11275 [Streptomyces sp. NPDC048416]|uniref:hypothetical protein n=1 Tax=Streptomyces sp. NPDC048416 TaxID=3365546 RepID=UPI003719CBC4
MPRSRAPRRRLTAVLVLVLGVLAVTLCGPASTATAAPAVPVPAPTPTPPKWVPSPAVAADRDAGAGALADAGPATSAPGRPGVAALPEAGAAGSVPGRPLVAAFADRPGTPGCKQGGRHQESEPAVPARARAAHDLAPVLGGGRPGHAEPCGLYAAHRDPPLLGPTPSAPGPVELSVLRV